MLSSIDSRRHKNLGPNSQLPIQGSEQHTSMQEGFPQCFSKMTDTQPLSITRYMPMYSRGICGTLCYLIIKDLLTVIKVNHTKSTASKIIDIKLD
jgi:hypothetical protein